MQAQTLVVQGKEQINFPLDPVPTELELTTDERDLNPH